LAVLKGKEYTGRVVLRGDASAGPIKVSLVWGEGDANRQTVTIRRPDRKFKTYNLKFKAGADFENANLKSSAQAKALLPSAPLH
jgi:alpha-N-arabinofuranosidase